MTADSSAAPNPRLEAALGYARSDIPVFPAEPHGKKPLTKNGFKDATTDEAQIRAWWAKNPDANVAIPTGAVSRIAVLDVDKDKGGFESLDALIAEFGALPATPHAISGGGGEHYFFAHPGKKVGNRVALRPGIDVRGDGGYIIVDPSVHASGMAYAWKAGCALGQIDLAPMPAFMGTEEADSAPPPKPKAKSKASPDEKLRRRAEKYVEKVPGESEGGRNAAAFKLAGKLRALVDANGLCLDNAVILELLGMWNARCAPPLPDSELRQCMDSAGKNGTPPPPKPPRDDTPPSSNTSASSERWFKLTDTGNAERLVHHCGGDLRFCHLWKKWLAWQGDRWTIDDDGRPMLISKRVVRGMYGEAERCEDPAIREAIVEWAHRCEKVDRRKALVELAKSEKGIPIRPSDLDRHDFALNCLNGTLDLKTFLLRPHRREDYLTKVCPTRYVPDAPCPTWLAFLERVLPDDEVRDFMQRFIGYSLTGDVSEQVLLLLLGDGANGKSTFVRAIQDVLSTDYAIQISSDLLIAKQQRNHPTEIADLFGIRLAFGIETAEEQAFDEALIKQLTGGDRIKARRMKEDFWEFSPTHKIGLITNHMPKIVGTDHAIWRRLLLVRFNVTIPRKERDRSLQSKLLAEREGILAWAVRGCQAWAKDGLQIPDSVVMSPPNSGSKLTVVEQFIDLYIRRIVGIRTRAAELYSHFTTFCETNGVTRASQQEFGTTLGRKGFGGKKSGGVMVYIDTAFIDPDGEDQGGEGPPSALNALVPLAKESMRDVVPLVPSPPQTPTDHNANSLRHQNDRPAIRTCFACKRTRFWRRRDGTELVCGTCHAPGVAPDLVVWIGDDGGATSSRGPGTSVESRKVDSDAVSATSGTPPRSPRSGADDVASALECDSGPEVA